MLIVAGQVRGFHTDFHWSWMFIPKIWHFISNVSNVIYPHNSRLEFIHLEHDPKSFWKSHFFWWHHNVGTVTNYIFHFNNAPHDPVISLYVHYIYYIYICPYIPLYPFVSHWISFYPILNPRLYALILVAYKHIFTGYFVGYTLVI